MYSVWKKDIWRREINPDSSGGSMYLSVSTISPLIALDRGFGSGFNYFARKECYILNRILYSFCIFLRDRLETY